MHPVAKLFLLTFVWIFFVSIVLSLLLMPFILGKGVEEFVKKKDFQDFIKGGSKVAWAHRARGVFQKISFFAFIGVILTIAAEAIVARLSK
jgi:hypothetical protein